VSKKTKPRKDLHPGQGEARKALAGLEALLRDESPPARDVTLARDVLGGIIKTAHPRILRFVVLGLLKLAEFEE
jgi:hypothetical protein